MDRADLNSVVFTKLQHTAAGDRTRPKPASFTNIPLRVYVGSKHSMALLAVLRDSDP